jgi:hypothetical protein
MRDAAPGVMSDQPARDVAHTDGHRMVRFVREHPALSILGTAGLGLFGGIELATGVLIGAAVLAALRPTNGTSLRDRARAILDHAPRDLRERARAVVQAARGKDATPSDQIPPQMTTH